MKTSTEKKTSFKTDEEESSDMTFKIILVGEAGTLIKRSRKIFTDDKGQD